jgi:hypothetical protein
MLPTGNETHILSSLGQPPAKISPHGTRTKNCYSHENLLKINSMTALFDL